MLPGITILGGKAPVPPLTSITYLGSVSQASSLATSASITNVPTDTTDPYIVLFNFTANTLSANGKVYQGVTLNGESPLATANLGGGNPSFSLHIFANPSTSTSTFAYTNISGLNSSVGDVTVATWSVNSLTDASFLDSNGDIVAISGLLELPTPSVWSTTEQTTPVGFIMLAVGDTGSSQSYTFTARDSLANPLAVEEDEDTDFTGTLGTYSYGLAHTIDPTGLAISINELYCDNSLGTTSNDTVFLAVLLR